MPMRLLRAGAAVLLALAGTTAQARPAPPGPGAAGPAADRSGAARGPHPHLVADVLPPGIPADDPMVAKGFLPVTLFGATPDDGQDDTAALQRAIDAARDAGLAVFFPPGEYLVSDTLRAMQPVTEKDGRWRQDRRRANALIGSVRGGARPVLRLAAGAAGFDDPSHPKPLVWIWAAPIKGPAAGSTRPEDEQPNISFNQVFRGIDIDLRGAGHAGAVGIRHAGSQGSSIESVLIHAEGAFAGLYNLPGQGGGVYDLEVSGGRYGVWANHLSRYPVLAGVRLEGQERAALFWNGQSNLTLAGFTMQRSRPGAAVTLMPGRQPYNRALTLVDGLIQGRGEVAVDNTAGRNLYLSNLQASGFSALVRSAGRPPVGRAALAEYAYTGSGSRSLVDGQRREAGDEMVTPGGPSGASGDDLVARHLWPAPLPSVEDQDAVSITRYGARPDGRDATEAIRAALAQHRKVFIPKGSFTVSGTLRLASGTQLFGAGKHLSILQAAPGWHPAPGTPLVTTADDAGATTTLSDLLLERPGDAPGITLLEWRAGRGSVVRDVMGGRSRVAQQPPAVAGSTYAVRGNGGGRWYGLTAEWDRLRLGTRGPGYRQLLVEGTREPLAFYGPNIERGLSDPQAEIVDARNVALYGLKGESLAEPQGAAVLEVRGSHDVSVFGYSGNAAPHGNAVIRVVDSDDYLLANVMPVKPGEGFDTVVAQSGGTHAAIDGLHPAAVVQKGRPRPPPAQTENGPPTLKPAVNLSRETERAKRHARE